MTKTKTIKYCNSINIGKCHFTISYRPENNGERYQVAVMSIADDIEDIRVALLDSFLPQEVIQLVEKEIVYFLYELNPTASANKKISYLCYYSTHTIANHMGSISWSYISGVTKDNIIYYIKTRSKIFGIFFNSIVRDLQQCYVQLIVMLLFDRELRGSTPMEATEYNKNLYHIHKLVFHDMPSKDGFYIDENSTVVELSKLLSDLNIEDYCHILNYLKHIEILKSKDIPMLMKFFYVNKKLHKNNTN